MTLATRNAVLFACVSLAALLMAAYLFALIFVFQTTDQPIADLIPTTQRWFVWTWDISPQTGPNSVIAAGALGLLSFLTLLFSTRVFRRVTSAEIYFFAVFLFTLAMDQIRVSQLLLIITNQPLQYGVVVTRVVMFGRLVGSFTLFTASLYAVGVEFPRIGTLTLLTTALAFVIVWFVPVDTLHLTASLIHVTGGHGSIDIVITALALLTIVDYVVAGVRGHREKGLAVSLSAAALVVGRELVFRSFSLVALAIGGALLLYGCVTYIAVNRRYYLWY